MKAEEVKVEETKEEVKKEEPPKAPAKKGKAIPFKNPLAPSEPTVEMIKSMSMVMGATTASWVIGYFSPRGGYWNLMVLAVVALGGGLTFVLKGVKNRLQDAARTYAERNAQRKPVVTDDETVEWINATLFRIWQFAEPEVCRQVRASVEPKLAELKVPGVKALELRRFTLGKLPPFISNAKFLTRDNHNNLIADDRIVLNLSVGLHAPDLEVVVAAKTVVGAVLPVCVKELWFQGTLRLEVNLVPEFPHAKTATVTFLDKPFVDVNIVPLNTINIFGDIPGLAQLLQYAIVGGINDNLVNPEKFSIELMPPEGGPIEASSCVMFITCSEATYKEGGLFGGGGKQLAYVEFRVGKEVITTQPIQADSAASVFAFNQTVSLLVRGKLSKELVSIELKSKRMAGVKTLGKVVIPVADVVNAPNMTLADTLDFETTEGSIRFQLTLSPLPKVQVEPDEGEEEAKAEDKRGKEAEEKKDAEDTLTVPAPRMEDLIKDTRSGSLLVRIHGARDLTPKDSNGRSDPYAKLFYMNRELAQTEVVKTSLNPVWDFHKELTVANSTHVKFTLRLCDWDDAVVGSDDELGDLDLDLTELFKPDAAGNSVYRVDRQWFPLRKPGPPEVEKALTAADLKAGRTGEVKNLGFGNVCVSLIFRPAKVPSTVSDFRCDVGNEDDDLSVTCYNSPNIVSGAAGALGKGLGMGIGAVGSGIGAIGSGAVAGVGALGSGVAAVGTGVASGFTGAFKAMAKPLGRKSSGNGSGSRQ